MPGLAKRLMSEEEGQGMTEYALVLGVIAVGAIASIIAFRTQILNLWNAIVTNVTDAITTMTS